MKRLPNKAFHMFVIHSINTSTNHSIRVESNQSFFIQIKGNTFFISILSCSILQCRLITMQTLSQTCTAMHWCRLLLTPVWQFHCEKIHTLLLSSPQLSSPSPPRTSPSHWSWSSSPSHRVRVGVPLKEKYSPRTEISN